MSVLNETPIPVDDPIAQSERDRQGRPNPQAGRITRPWIDYFTSQGTSQTQTPSRVASTAEESATASISAVDISNGLLAAGSYRFSYVAHITQAATTSSSLEVTLDWTYRGNAYSYTGPAITGNTVNDSQGWGQPIVIDAASPVRYSTTYASSGATPMQYDLAVILERLPE